MNKNNSHSFHRPILFVLFLLLPGAFAFSQASRKTTTLIGSYITAAKTGEEKPDISNLLDNEKRHTDVLLAVQGYYTDTVYKAAIEAYKITYTIARKNSKTETKQQCVELICRGINSSNRSIGAWCVQHLSVFFRGDFNKNSKDIISAALVTGTPKLSELIKIAGYLNLHNNQDKIEMIAQNSKKTSQKWSAWLALARMGNEKYISRVAETVRRQELNDDVVYELVPGLIYTRKKEAFSVAVEILYNDKKKCFTSSPDNPVRIECGYRVMEYLAPVVKDFPYGVKASGDIDTDNYKNALTEVRKWFLEKGDSYEIIDGSF